MKLYTFRRVPLSIIRSLVTVHSAMVYVIQVCRQLLSRSICSINRSSFTVHSEMVYVIQVCTNLYDIYHC